MRTIALQNGEANAKNRFAMIGNQPSGNLTREDQLAARIGIADAGCGCLEPALPRDKLSRFARAMLWIFGDNAPLPLANVRLEMVRRFFCATRAGHSPSVTLMSELQRLGLQPIHLAQMESLLN